MPNWARQLGNANKRPALDVLVEETQLMDESRVTGEDTSHLGAYDEDRIRKAVNNRLCFSIDLHDGNLPNVISIPYPYFTLKGGKRQFAVFPPYRLYVRGNGVARSSEDSSFRPP